MVNVQYTPAKSLMGRSLNDLTQDAANFCAAQNLPHIDMAELVLRENLTANQREWVDAFMAAWEAQE